MADERAYTAKENARESLTAAIETYLEAADQYEMGAQETSDELSDIFHNLRQPYKVETSE